VIVPDRHGTGTNALLLAPPDALEPSFGPGSCRRHAQLARRAGIAHVILPVPSLALDIDTPEDLTELGRLGDRAPTTNALVSGC
jgi:2-phospho-L-lactate guanylyltransferase